MSPFFLSEFQSKLPAHCSIDQHVRKVIVTEGSRKTTVIGHFALNLSIDLSVVRTVHTVQYYLSVLTSYSSARNVLSRFMLDVFAFCTVLLVSVLMMTI
jgi:multisubunit Na+/H+ antiporter MnhB subunit